MARLTRLADSLLKAKLAPRVNIEGVRNAVISVAVCKDDGTRLLKRTLSSPSAPILGSDRVLSINP